MKRTILATALLLIASAATIKAQNITDKDSTRIISHPDTVKITNAEKHISIEVIDNGSVYRLHRELTEDNVTVLKEKQEWNFDIPFIGNKNKKEKRRHNATLNTDILCDMQFGIGLASATEQAEGMNVKMANCGMEFTLNKLISCEYRPIKNTAFEANFGVNWRNFRMKGENRFLKEDSQVTIAPYPDGSDINFSRLKIFSLTMELMLRQHITRELSISVGPVVNFNTHGSLKTRYKLDGKGYKLTSSNINQNAVTYDLKAQIAVNSFGLYFKYSPVNVLDTSYGPKFHPMSAGILLML